MCPRGVQVADTMRKIAFNVRHKRLDFRAIMTDFDRTTKTRSGTLLQRVAAVAAVWSSFFAVMPS